MNYLFADKCWFALYTKSKHEFKAEWQLNSLGIESYLPTITHLRQWADRKKMVTEPLLKGYIFIYGTEKHRLIALEQHSIVRCVFDRGRPARIPEFEIENLKNFIKDKEEYLVVNGLVKGSKIRIKDGPFKDVIGVIIEDSNKKSLAVSIELLNRTIIAHISEGNIIEVIPEKKAV